MKTLGDVQAIVVNEAFKSFEEFRKEKMKFIQQANETNTIEGILDLFYFTNYAEGSRMLEGVNAKILKELSEFLGIELKKDSYRIYGRLNNGLTKVIINSESKKYYVERDFYGAEMWHKNEIKKSRRWLSRVKAFRRLYERAKNKKTIKNLIILARAASTDRELHFWLMLKMWGRLYKKNFLNKMAVSSARESYEDCKREYEEIVLKEKLHKEFKENDETIKLIKTLLKEGNGW